MTDLNWLTIGGAVTIWLLWFWLFYHDDGDQL